MTEIRHTIIAAFPGVGKTTLIESDPRFVDLESSDYKWLDSNGEWDAVAKLGV